jgi:hypothetical protein
MIRVGRKPQGADLLRPLPGSSHAKQRMHWFLQTLSGQRTVPEACAALEVGPSRFFAQRAAWLQEALALLEPRSPGRPPSTRPTPSATELTVLSHNEQVEWFY